MKKTLLLLMFLLAGCGNDKQLDEEAKKLFDNCKGTLSQTVTRNAPGGSVSITCQESREQRALAKTVPSYLDDPAGGK
jgi:uncharacterized lipoprotein YajG